MASGYVGTPNIVKLALGDGTDSIILSNISDGVDGATPTPIAIEDIGEFTHEDGQHGVSGRKWSLTMSGMVSAFTDAGVVGSIADGQAKLLSWANSETQLEVAGITLGGYGFTSGNQNLAYYIDSCQKYTTPSGRVYFTVKITQEALGGAISGIESIPVISENILTSKTVWTSTNSTFPVGLSVRTVTGVTGESFITPSFEVTYNTVGAVDYAYDIFFPFVGVTLQASAPFGLIDATATNQNEMTIEEYNYNGVVNGSSEVTIVELTTPTLSRTLSNAALYSVRFRFLFANGGASGIGQVNMNQPILKITNIN